MKEWAILETAVKEAFQGGDLGREPGGSEGAVHWGHCRSPEAEAFLFHLWKKQDGHVGRGDQDRKGGEKGAAKSKQYRLKGCGGDL